MVKKAVFIQRNQISTSSEKIYQQKTDFTEVKY